MAVGCVVTADHPNGYNGGDEKMPTSAAAAAAASTALINPANSALVGTARAYFPRGGPVPPPPPPGLQHSSSGWGGLDAGTGMLYPAQVVDGLTHMHAGPELRGSLAGLPADANGSRCPIGAVVLTDAYRLAGRFHRIAHTPTPFWPAAQSNAATTKVWRSQLLSCYLSSILALADDASLSEVHHEAALEDMCFAEANDGPADWTPPPASMGDPSAARLTIATPLLGAGAAGASVEDAAVVLKEAVRCLTQLQRVPAEGRRAWHQVHLRLVVPDNATRDVVRRVMSFLA